MNKSLKDITGTSHDRLTTGARGGAIAFALKILNTGLGFINQIILARVLGAGGVGEVILAVTVVRIASQISKFGMEETMMKFVPLYIDNHDKPRLKGTIMFGLGFALICSLVFMALIFFLSRFMALSIFHAEGLLKLLPVIALAIPAWVIRDITSGILRGHHDALRALVPESLVSPFVKIMVFLILIMHSVSPLYAILAFVAGEIVAVTTSLAFLRNALQHLRSTVALYEKKKILDVAYTIIFTSMSVLVYTQADIWILGMFKSTEIVGIYGIAAKLVLLVYFPMLAFGAIIPPLISSIYASGNQNELREMVGASTRWILSIAMPIILILVIEGKFILSFAYGGAFSAGYIPLLILVTGQLIKASAGLIGVILQMSGGHRIYMQINILGGLLNIVLNLILVPRFGMIGAATATAFCLSMIDIICIFIIKKRLSILTIAKDMQFDILFISGVGALFLACIYMQFNAGPHILLFAALTVYAWKTIKHHDIPWQMLFAKYKSQ